MRCAILSDPLSNAGTLVGVWISTIRAKVMTRIILLHHRLAHTNYHTLESMKRLGTTVGINPRVHYGPIEQCVNCPFGKQTRAPFKQVETPPNNIGDLVVSDVCGPFETLIDDYRYFVTWLDVKS